LRARGVSVDTEGFSAAMQKQKAEARASWTGSGEATSEAHWFAVLDEVGRTEFLGYDTEEAEGQVLAIFKDGGRMMAAQTGEAVEIVTNQTPFYGESGGQAGDTGHITSLKAKGQVTDTQKWLGALHVHSVRVTEGSFLPGDAVDLIVDSERR